MPETYQTFDDDRMKTDRTHSPIETLKIGTVAVGLGILTLASYLDNLRGPLIPLIRESLRLDFSSASWVLVGGYFASLSMTLVLLSSAAKRLSEKRLTLIIIVFGVLALAFSNWVTSFGLLLFFSVLLGAVITGLGALSNIWVIKGTDTHSRARFLSLLHMMYGLGSLAAPKVLATVTGRNLNWVWSVLIVVPLLAVFIPILLYGRLVGSGADSVESSNSGGPPRKSDDSYDRKMITVSALYVTGEVLASTWLVSYLVEVQHLSFEESSGVLAKFFMAMFVSRAICFLGLKREYENTVYIGCLVAACGFFIAGYLGWSLGFALCGLFGPFFPIMVARISRNAADSRSLTLKIICGNQLALMITHFAVGRLADWVGLRTAYLLPMIFLVFAVLVVWIWDREPASVASAH